MNSYNLINGVHATQNEFLNLKVLKGEWGFKGVLVSDWDATYDGVAAANNGLDLEMPSPRFMNKKTLLAAVKDGTVKEATIDEKVLRLFRVALRYGFLDRPQFDPAKSTYSVSGRPVALKGARESLTLLKNEGNILPLNAAKVKTIAIIGASNDRSKFGNKAVRAFVQMGYKVFPIDSQPLDLPVFTGRNSAECFAPLPRRKWGNAASSRIRVASDC